MVDKRRLKQYDDWLSKKSKEVTKSPVFLNVNGHFKDKTEAARLTKFSRPTEYEIQFKESYYQRNQNDPRKIKSVMSHELAHVHHPNNHGPAFQKEARSLGAGRYSVARGKAKR